MALLAAVLLLAAASCAGGLSDPYLDDAVARQRTWSSKQLMGTGPVCAIVNDASAVFCHMPHGLLAHDDSFGDFTIPAHQGARFVEVVTTARDVWTLTDAGVLVVALDVGLGASGWTASANAACPCSRRNQSALVLGVYDPQATQAPPIIRLEVLPHIGYSYASTCDDATAFPRELCIMYSTGTWDCFTATAGTGPQPLVLTRQPNWPLFAGAGVHTGAFMWWSFPAGGVAPDNVPPANMDLISKRSISFCVSNYAKGWTCQDLKNAASQLQGLVSNYALAKATMVLTSACIDGLERLTYIGMDKDNRNPVCTSSNDLRACKSAGLAFAQQADYASMRGETTSKQRYYTCASNWNLQPKSIAIQEIAGGSFTGPAPLADVAGLFGGGLCRVSLGGAISCSNLLTGGAAYKSKYDVSTTGEDSGDWTLVSTFFPPSTGLPDWLPWKGAAALSPQYLQVGGSNLIVCGLRRQSSADSYVAGRPECHASLAPGAAAAMQPPSTFTSTAGYVLSPLLPAQPLLVRRAVVPLGSLDGLDTLCLELLVAPTDPLELDARAVLRYFLRVTGGAALSMQALATSPLLMATLRCFGRATAVQREVPAALKGGYNASAAPPILTASPGSVCFGATTSASACWGHAAAVYATQRSAIPLQAVVAAPALRAHCGRLPVTGAVACFKAAGPTSPLYVPVGLAAAFSAPLAAAASFMCATVSTTEQLRCWDPTGATNITSALNLGCHDATQLVGAAIKLADVSNASDVVLLPDFAWSNFTTGEATVCGLVRPRPGTPAAGLASTWVCIGDLAASSAGWPLDTSGCAPAAPSASAQALPSDVGVPVVTVAAATPATSGTALPQPDLPCAAASAVAVPEGCTAPRRAFAKVTAGWRHVCGITAGAAPEPLCWGRGVPAGNVSDIVSTAAAAAGLTPAATPPQPLPLIGSTCFLQEGSINLNGTRALASVLACAGALANMTTAAVQPVDPAFNSRAAAGATKNWTVVSIDELSGATISDAQCKASRRCASLAQVSRFVSGTFATVALAPGRVSLGGDAVFKRSLAGLTIAGTPQTEIVIDSLSSSARCAVCVQADSATVRDVTFVARAAAPPAANVLNATATAAPSAAAAATVPKPQYVLLLSGAFCTVQGVRFNGVAATKAVLAAQTPPAYATTVFSGAAKPAYTTSGSPAYAHVVLQNLAFDGCAAPIYIYLDALLYKYVSNVLARHYGGHAAFFVDVSPAASTPRWLYMRGVSLQGFIFNDTVAESAVVPLTAARGPAFTLINTVLVGGDFRATDVRHELGTGALLVASGADVLADDIVVDGAQYSALDGRAYGGVISLSSTAFTATRFTVTRAARMQSSPFLVHGSLLGVSTGASVTLQAVRLSFVKGEAPATITTPEQCGNGSVFWAADLGSFTLSNATLTSAVSTQHGGFAYLQLKANAPASMQGVVVQQKVVNAGQGALVAAFIPGGSLSVSGVTLLADIFSKSSVVMAGGLSSVTVDEFVGANISLSEGPGGLLHLDTDVASPNVRASGVSLARISGPRVTGGLFTLTAVPGSNPAFTVKHAPAGFAGSSIANTSVNVAALLYAGPGATIQSADISNLAMQNVVALGGEALVKVSDPVRAAFRLIGVTVDGAVSYASPDRRAGAVSLRGTRDSVTGVLTDLVMDTLTLKRLRLVTADMSPSGSGATGDAGLAFSLLDISTATFNAVDFQGWEAGQLNTLTTSSPEVPWINVRTLCTTTKFKVTGTSKVRDVTLDPTVAGGTLLSLNYPCIIDSTLTLQVSDLTVSNVTANDDVAGLHFVDESLNGISTSTIERSRFEGLQVRRAALAGAVALRLPAASFRKAVITVTDTVFDGCTATQAGGLLVEVNEYNSVISTLTISGTSFSRNRATEAEGGGLLVKGMEVKISSTMWTRNVAAGTGGGFQLVGCRGSMKSLRLESNRASVGGGGSLTNCMLGTFSIEPLVSLTPSQTLPPYYRWREWPQDAPASRTWYGLWAQGNVADSDAGALAIESCGVSLTRIVALSNTAGGSGGGLGVNFASVFSPFQLQEAVIVNNTAGGETGGAGLYFRSSSGRPRVGGVSLAADSRYWMSLAVADVMSRVLPAGSEASEVGARALALSLPTLLTSSASGIAGYVDDCGRSYLGCGYGSSTAPRWDAPGRPLALPACTDPSVTPTSSPSATLTPTPSASPSALESSTVSASATPSASRGGFGSASLLPVSAPAVAASVAGVPPPASATASPASASPTVSSTPSGTSTSSGTPSATATSSKSGSLTPSATPTPSVTPSASFLPCVAPNSAPPDWQFYVVSASGTWLGPAKCVVATSTCQFETNRNALAVGATVKLMAWALIRGVNVTTTVVDSLPSCALSDFCGAANNRCKDRLPSPSASVSATPSLSATSSVTRSVPASLSRLPTAAAASGSPTPSTSRGTSATPSGSPSPSRSPTGVSESWRITTCGGGYNDPALPGDVKWTPTRGARTFNVLFGLNEATGGPGGDVRLEQAQGLSASLRVTGVLSVGSKTAMAGASVYTSRADSVIITDSVFEYPVAGRAVTDGSGAAAPVSASNSSASTTSAASLPPQVAAPGALATDGRVLGVGGAVALEDVSVTNITSSWFARGAAVRGGGVWLARSSAKQRVNAASVSWDRNVAAWGGGNAFFESPSSAEQAFVPSSGVGGSVAGWYGNSVATRPSFGNVTFGTGLFKTGEMIKGVNFTGLVVLSAVAMPVDNPVLRVWLWDAFGQLVRSDNTTTCTLEAIRADDGSLLPLKFSPTYTARQGVVTVDRFGVQENPDVVGQLTVSCVTADVPVLRLPLDPIPIATGRVEVRWSDATLAVKDWWALPSSVGAPVPIDVSKPVIIQTSAPDTVLPCTLTATRVSTNESVTVLGEFTKTAGGFATFRPGFSAPSGDVIRLSAACTWLTGEAISVPAPLEIRIAKLKAAWLLGPVPVCPDSSAPEAAPNASWPLTCLAVVLPPAGTPAADDAKWQPQPLGTQAAAQIDAALQHFVALDAGMRAAAASFPSELPAGWRLPADGSRGVVDLVIAGPTGAAYDGMFSGLQLPSALPSADGNTFLLAPPPRAVLLSSVGGGSNFSFVRDTKVSCGLLVQTSSNAVVLGNVSVTLAAGIASFPGVALRRTGLNSAAGVQASCAWVTGEDVTTSVSMVRSETLVPRFVTDNPAAPFPSAMLAGSYASQGVYVNTTSPVQLMAALQVTVEQRHAPLWQPLYTSTSVPPPRASRVSNPRISCVLNVTEAATPAAGSFALVNSLPAPLDQANATLAAFQPVSVVAPSFGVRFRFGVTCTWVDGATFGGLSEPVYVANVSASFDRLPPLFLLPSAPAVSQPVLWNPLPRLQLNAIFPAVGSNGSAASSNDSAVAFVTVPLPVNGIPCSLDLGPNVTVQGNAAPKSDAGAVVFQVAATGSFDVLFTPSATCTWVSGVRVPATGPPMCFPEVGLFNSTVIPPRPLYNTKLDPTVAVRLGWRPCGSNASEPWRYNFTELGAAADDLRCSLTARLLDAATGGSEPVSSTGTTLVTMQSNTGSGSFNDAALLPRRLDITLEQLSVANASSILQELAIDVSCTSRSLPVPATLRSPATVELPRVGFLQPPPERTLPAPLTGVDNVFDVTVQLMDFFYRPLREDNVPCTLEVAEKAAPPSVGAFTVFLVGDIQVRTKNDGTAVFKAIGVNGPLGSWAVIRAVCTRPQGGTVLPVTQRVLLNNFNVEWTLLPDPKQLYNTPVRVGAVVTSVDLDPFTWARNESSAKVESRVACRLALNAEVPAKTVGGIAGRDYMTLTGSDRDVSNVTAADGSVEFNFAAVGPGQSNGTVAIVCTVASQAKSSALLPITIQQTALLWTVPPPLVWVPSSGIAKTPVSPPPSVRLVLASNTSEGVDASGATCYTTVTGPGVLTDNRIDGYRPVLNSSLSPAERVQQAKAVNISFPGLQPDGDFGSTVNLTVYCLREQGDRSALLYHPIRIVDALAQPVPGRWFPSSTTSDRPMEINLWLVDAGAPAGESTDATAVAPSPFSNSSSTTRRLLLLANGSAPVAPARAPANLIKLDNQTTCNILLTSGNGNVSASQVTAAQGVVRFVGVSVKGLTNSRLAGQVQCSLGAHAYPLTNMTWQVDISACGPGYAPKRDDPTSCEICPPGQYSDGGQGAVCRTCPRTGVTCSSGIISYLPGFYRLQDPSLPGYTTVDENTELHPCFNEIACRILNATERNAAKSHGCLKGYSGPLCGVCATGFGKTGTSCSPCWPAALNVFVLALLPVGFLGFGYWVSVVRKQARSSMAGIVFRILTTYLQSLSVLGSLYQARGSLLFRRIFGIADVVGDSILQISPIQCTAPLGYYTRFSLTLMLPVIMAGLAVTINILRILVLRLRPLRRVAVCSRRSRWTLPVIRFIVTDERTAALVGSSRGIVSADAGVTTRSKRNSTGNGSVTAADHRERLSLLSVSRMARVRSQSVASANPLGQARPLSAASGGGILPGTSPLHSLPDGTTAVVPSLAPDLDAIAAELGVSSTPKTLGMVSFGAGLQVALRQVATDVRSFFKASGWIAPVIFILNISYSSITTTSFSIFKCRPNAIGGVNYLSMSLEVPCGTPVHTLGRVFAGAVIALFVAGLPLFFWRVLRRNKHRLADPKVFGRWGFLYDGLKPQYYAYETVTLSRKALIVCIGALVVDPYNQVVAALALLVASITLQAVLQPFSDHRINRIETTGLLGIIATEIASIFYLRSTTIASPCMTISDPTARLGPNGEPCSEVLQDFENSDIIVTIVLTAINGLALAYLGYHLIRAFIGGMEEKRRKRIEALWRRASAPLQPAVRHLSRLRRKRAKVLTGAYEGAGAEAHDGGTRSSLDADGDIDAAAAAVPAARATEAKEVYEGVATSSKAMHAAGPGQLVNAAGIAVAGFGSGTTGLGKMPPAPGFATALPSVRRMPGVSAPAAGPADVSPLGIVKGLLPLKSSSLLTAADAPSRNSQAVTVVINNPFGRSGGAAGSATSHGVGSASSSLPGDTDALATHRDLSHTYSSGLHQLGSLSSFTKAATAAKTALVTSHRRVAFNPLNGDGVAAPTRPHVAAPQPQRQEGWSDDDDDVSDKEEAAAVPSSGRSSAAPSSDEDEEGWSGYSSASTAASAPAAKPPSKPRSEDGWSSSSHSPSPPALSPATSDEDDENWRA